MTEAAAVLTLAPWGVIQQIEIILFLFHDTQRGKVSRNTVLVGAK